MATTNNITNDKLISRAQTKEYTQGHDAIDWTVKLNTDEPLCYQCGELSNECQCTDK